MRPQLVGERGFSPPSLCSPSPRAARDLMTAAAGAATAASTSDGSPPPPPPPPPNPLRDFFAGGVAGAANLTAGYAFDTVKVWVCVCCVRA